MVSIKKKYIELTNTKVAGLIDDIPVELAFHCILGQAYKNYKIKFGSEHKDVRISVFIIMPPRTGKGQITKVLKDVCDELGITHAKVTTGSSDAGLAGSIDKEAYAYNLKNSLDSEHPDYRDPIIKGDLGTFDILTFEESKHLITPSKFAEDTLTLLQESQDTPGLIRKKLSHGEAIEYESTTSIWATTYYLDKIQDVLTEQGFFHRLIIYQKDYNIKESLRLRLEIIKLFSKERTDQKVVERCNVLRKEICEEINRFRSDETRYLVMSEQAIETLNEFMKQFHKIMSQYSGTELMILLSFSQSLLDLSVKIGAHYAILSNSKEITKAHIIQSYGILKKSVDTWVNKLKIGASGVTKTQRSIENIQYHKFVLHLNKLEFSKFKKKDMMLEIKRYFKMSYTKATVILDDLLTKNFVIEEAGEKNAKIYTTVTE